MFRRFGSVFVACLVLGLLGCNAFPSNDSPSNDSPSDDFPNCEDADPLCSAECNFPDGTSTGLTLDACQAVQDACEAMGGEYVVACA